MTDTGPGLSELTEAEVSIVTPAMENLRSSGAPIMLDAVDRVLEIVKGPSVHQLVDQDGRVTAFDATSFQGDHTLSFMYPVPNELIGAGIQDEANRIRQKFVQVDFVYEKGQYNPSICVRIPDRGSTFLGPRYDVALTEGNFGLDPRVKVMNSGNPAGKVASLISTLPSEHVSINYQKGATRGAIRSVGKE